VPDLTPIAQAAAEFKVSQATLYNYLKTGQLKRYKRGMDRKTYLDRDEIRRLLKPRVVKG
jgi:predicted site-specific integrase-resolvase